MVPRKTKETESYLQAFERFESRVTKPSWVFPLRKAGISHFADQGFPTLKDEDWRFTNIAPLTRLPFKPAVPSPARGVTPEQIQELTFGKLAARRLVFVNGCFAPELSQPLAEDSGLFAGSIGAALERGVPDVEKHLARYASSEHNPFTALNTAFFQDGAFIHIPSGRQIAEPLHLLFISTAAEAGTTFHPRNLILADSRSRATILESYVALADAPYITNAVTEVAVGDGAILEHCKFQDEAPGAFHVAAIHAQLGRACNFISHSLATGARLSRNNIRTRLDGEGLECILNGLYLTKDEQLADHHMVVEHAKPHCNSHEYYNGILDGRSRGVFHGRILVQQLAQKTDAKQTNKNLLLSDDATADTKPQLEIYADDVKCTHGATIGQLNEDSIFYLRARGIDLETARRMLIHAFAGEIIDRVRHTAVREELDKLVWERLEANPHVGAAK